MNLEQLDQEVLGAGETWPAEAWTVLNVTPHPVAPLPDDAWLQAHTVAELLEFLNHREETIYRMAANPAEYGYEPPVWRILDAICGFPWVDPEWALKVRRVLLHQDDAVKILLVNGANRASKSEWAASRVVRLLMLAPRSRAWCFHQDDAMSVEYQQPLLYKYLHPDLKTEKGIRRNPTYIAYKQQTGFSEGRFVLPNFSDCSFRNYEQDPKKIEGGELNVAWCDELVPASWIQTLKARIATRFGWILITFTPITGYNATVKMFLDVAQKTRESVAFLLPKDGGKPETALALQGEDVMAWLDGRDGQPPAPAGREFERVPRVMRCHDRRSAIFFLHSWDNPFGNAAELISLYADAGANDRKIRFYGVATKQIGGQFPKFNPIVHMIAAEKIPARGTLYMFMDPCSGRNWFMLWALVVRSPIGKQIFIKREWPCPGKYVPGVGEIGPWAEPGEKHDGVRGPGQQPLGWGLSRYKAEIYRLEGRKNWESVEKEPAEPFRFDKDDAPDPRPFVNPRRQRRPEEGEEIYLRSMDSRYGAAPTQTSEGQTTLLESCAEIGLDFVPASGRKIEEGIDLINDLLDYDQDRKPDPLNNAPHLFVCDECQNLIFALQNWTGADGKEGACKDPIDVLRYLVLADPDDYSEKENAA